MQFVIKSKLIFEPVLPKNLGIFINLHGLYFDSINNSEKTISAHIYGEQSLTLMYGAIKSATT